jgi:hypothetical protein
MTTYLSLQLVTVLTNGNSSSSSSIVRDAAQSYLQYKHRVVGDARRVSSFMEQTTRELQSCQSQMENDTNLDLNETLVQLPQLLCRLWPSHLIKQS